MNKLSVCLIVKNEERVLARCLSCAARIADELVVVDTGSTDRSVEIAKKFTPHVYLHPWQNSFAEARNFSYAQATGDYIMWLDADDVIDDESIARLNALKAEETEADVILAIYRNDSEDGLYSYIIRDRIVKRSVFPGWKHDIHEAIPLQPDWKRSYRTDIEIIHKKEYVNEPNRNLDIFFRLLESGKPLQTFEKASLVKEYSLHGRMDEALKLFKELRPEDYGYEYARVYLANGFMREKRWRECLSVIEDAERYIAFTPQMLFVKGRCMESLGDDQRAEALYQQATNAEEDPYSQSIRYTGYKDYYPYLRLAAIAQRNGDKQRALNLLRRAGNAYPKAEEWQRMRQIIWMDIQEQHNHEKDMAATKKSNEELKRLREEMNRLKEKLGALSEEELEKVVGGNG